MTVLKIYLDHFTRVAKNQQIATVGGLLVFALARDKADHEAPHHRIFAARYNQTHGEHDEHD